MVFGFDIDDTITAAPEVFAALGRSLIRCGHQVVIITGAEPHADTTHGSLAWRQGQLLQCGMLVGVHYDAIYIARGDSHAEIGRSKAGLCKSLNVALMIDDKSIFCHAIREVTCCALFLAHGGN